MPYFTLFLLNKQTIRTQEKKRLPRELEEHKIPSWSWSRILLWCRINTTLPQSGFPHHTIRLIQGWLTGPGLLHTSFRTEWQRTTSETQSQYGTLGSHVSNSTMSWRSSPGFPGNRRHSLDSSSSPISWSQRRRSVVVFQSWRNTHPLHEDGVPNCDSHSDCDSDLWVRELIDIFLLWGGGIFVSSRGIFSFFYEKNK